MRKPSSRNSYVSETEHFWHKHRDVRELEGLLQNEAEALSVSLSTAERPFQSVQKCGSVARVFLVLSFFFSKFINETDVTEWLYHFLLHKCQERQKNPNNFKKKNPKNLDTYNVNKSLFPYLLQFVSRFSSIYIQKDLDRKIIHPEKYLDFPNACRKK